MDKRYIIDSAVGRIKSGEAIGGVVLWLWDQAYQAGSMKVTEKSVTLSQEEYARLKNFEVTRLSVRVGHMENELEKAESEIRQLKEGTGGEYKAPEDTPKTRPPGW
jgi:hypothetical protein